MTIGGGFIDILKLIGRLSPECFETIERRYTILRAVEIRQPVGRRALSVELGLKERTVRSEVEKLKELKLLNADNMGMYVTDDGKYLLLQLGDIYQSIRGIPNLRKKLQDSLGIENVIVVPGDSGENDLILQEMGRTASRYLIESLKDDDIVGVTGGSTMAAVSDQVKSDKAFPGVTVIPARGGLGKELMTQANSVAAKIGKSLGAMYRMLYIPDNLDQEALEIVQGNDDIRQSLQMIEEMRILIFGIGRADVMAGRRNLSEERIGYLMDNGAVAEAFGHYFDIKGKDIWEYKTVGLSLERYRDIPQVIGVAGGVDKAEAIIAIASIRKNFTLILDEAVGNRIIKIIN
ncbi:MAG: sugar-binding transcriptional regulator [Bacillota bacterium]